ncbi:MAG: KTSC domain-containing protein [Anaerovoracaceae bacterium]
MQMHNVVSSNVSAIGYDKGELFVEFSNGRLYVYSAVPEYHFLNLLEAESVGSYLDQKIKKGGYVFKQLA